MLSKETIASDGALAFGLLAWDQPDHLLKLLKDAEAGTSGLWPRFLVILPPCLGKDLDAVMAGLQMPHPEKCPIMQV